MGKYYSMLIYMSMEINVKATNMVYNCQMAVNFHNFFVFIELFPVYLLKIITGYEISKYRPRLFFY